MALELVYTSAMHGLRPGTSGFCTVAMSRGMPPALVPVLESLSGYRQADSGHGTDVLAFWRIEMPGGVAHVLSAVGPAPPDHTQRTNKIAAYLVLRPDELSPAGPAWLLGRPGLLRRAWSGPASWLEDQVAVPRSDSSGPRVCSAWKRAAGDAGWAGTVASAFLREQSRPIHVVLPPTVAALELADEVICLLPPWARWRATFSTHFLRPVAGVPCALRFCVEGTEAAESARRSKVMLVDLVRGVGPAPDGRHARMARSGIDEQEGATARSAGERRAVGSPGAHKAPAAARNREIELAPVSEPAVRHSASGDGAAMSVLSGASSSPYELLAEVEHALLARERDGSIDASRERSWVLVAFVSVGLTLLVLLGGALLVISRSEPTASSVASEPDGSAVAPRLPPPVGPARPTPEGTSTARDRSPRGDGGSRREAPSPSSTDPAPTAPSSPSKGEVAPTDPGPSAAPKPSTASVERTDAAPAADSAPPRTADAGPDEPPLTGARWGAEKFISIPDRSSERLLPVEPRFGTGTTVVMRAPASLLAKGVRAEGGRLVFERSGIDVQAAVRPGRPCFLEAWLIRSGGAPMAQSEVDAVQAALRTCAIELTPTDGGDGALTVGFWSAPSTTVYANDPAPQVIACDPADPVLVQVFAKAAAKARPSVPLSEAWVRAGRAEDLPATALGTVRVNRSVTTDGAITLSVVTIPEDEVSKRVGDLTRSAEGAPEAEREAISARVKELRGSLVGVEVRICLPSGAVLACCTVKSADPARRNAK